MSCVLMVKMVKSGFAVRTKTFGILPQESPRVYPSRRILCENTKCSHRTNRLLLIKLSNHCQEQGITEATNIKGIWSGIRSKENDKSPQYVGPYADRRLVFRVEYGVTRIPAAYAE